MQLSDQQIKEFQEMYRERFEETLTHEEAYEKAIKFLRFLKIMHDPNTQPAKSRAP